MDKQYESLLCGFYEFLIHTLNYNLKIKLVLL